MRALADAAGVAVVDHARLEDRPGDLHQRVMDDAVAEGRGRDAANLGLLDREVAVGAGYIGLVAQFLAQGHQVLLQIELELRHASPLALAAAPRLAPGQPEVLQVVDLGVEVFEGTGHGRPSTNGGTNSRIECEPARAWAVCACAGAHARALSAPTCHCGGNVCIRVFVYSCHHSWMAAENFSRVPAGHGPQGRMRRAGLYHMPSFSVYLDRGQGTGDRVLNERTPGDTKAAVVVPVVREAPATERAPHVCSIIVAGTAAQDTKTASL